MIKVIALDIYGTVLAIDDADNELPIKKGLEALFKRCNEKGIRIVSSSDNNIEWTKADLEASGVEIKKFDAFYRLTEFPKDFSRIIQDYNIQPAELLVIGDSDKDVNGAIKCRTCYIIVPEYFNSPDDFDLSRIKF